jgi:cell shape-determining protein MreC
MPRRNFIQWISSLNPFSDYLKARKELKELNTKNKKLEKELKELEEKRKKLLYLKQ